MEVSMRPSVGVISQFSGHFVFANFAAIALKLGFLFCSTVPVSVGV
jgi:hypothetical protein